MTRFDPEEHARRSKWLEDRRAHYGARPPGRRVQFQAPSDDWLKGCPVFCIATLAVLFWGAVAVWVLS